MLPRCNGNNGCARLAARLALCVQGEPQLVLARLPASPRQGWQAFSDLACHR